MPARLNRRHQQMVRDKIQVSQLINRLEKHIDGDLEMSPTQLNAAEFLINQGIGKAPQAVTVSGDEDAPLNLGLRVIFGERSTPPTET